MYSSSDYIEVNNYFFIFWLVPDTEKSFTSVTFSWRTENLYAYVDDILCTCVPLLYHECVLICQC